MLFGCFCRSRGHLTVGSSGWFKKFMTKDTLEGDKVPLTPRDYDYISDENNKNQISTYFNKREDSDKYNFYKTAKEYRYFKTELANEKQQLEKMEADGADEYNIKQQKEVIDAINMMLPDAQRRLGTYWNKMGTPEHKDVQ